MSDSKSSSVKSPRLSMLDSDMAAAAQQLIQLSDENNKSNCCNSNDNKKIKTKMIESQSQDEITSAKIEEIFGKEDEISRPAKKRRYQSLESIYKETKPIKVSNGKNLWN